MQGIESVPFCSGYSPTNGQFVQYTTGSSPNPCYAPTTAVSCSGSTCAVPSGDNLSVGNTVLPVGWVDARTQGTLIEGCSPADDNGPTINAAINTAFAGATSSVGGIVLIPPGGCYQVKTGIVLKNNVRLKSFGSSGQDSPLPATRIACVGAITCISAASGSASVGIEGISIIGPSFSSGPTVAGSVGISLPAASSAVLRDLFIDHFGGQCISITTGGQVATLDSVFAADCQNNSILASVTGQVDVGASDASLNNVSVNGYYTTATTGSYGSGYNAALVVRGPRVKMVNSYGDLSQVGVVCLGSGTISNSAAYANQGPGFVIAGASCALANNEAFGNGLSATGTYPQFSTTGGGNALTGNAANDTFYPTSVASYSFYDSGPNTSLPNYYEANHDGTTAASGIFGCAGGANSSTSFSTWQSGIFLVGNCASGSGGAKLRLGQMQIFNPAGDTNNKYFITYNNAGSGFAQQVFAKCTDTLGSCVTWMQVYTTNGAVQGISLNGGVQIPSSTAIPQVGTPTVGQAACIKAAGPPVVLGYCSTTPTSGTCTCN